MELVWKLFLLFREFYKNHFHFQILTTEIQKQLIQQISKHGTLFQQRESATSIIMYSKSLNIKELIFQRLFAYFLKFKIFMHKKLFFLLFFPKKSEKTILPPHPFVLTLWYIELFFHLISQILRLARFILVYLLHNLLPRNIFTVQQNAIRSLYIRILHVPRI